MVRIAGKRGHEELIASHVRRRIGTRPVSGGACTRVSVGKVASARGRRGERLGCRGVNQTGWWRDRDAVRGRVDRGDGEVRRARAVVRSCAGHGHRQCVTPRVRRGTRGRPVGGGIRPPVCEEEDWGTCGRGPVRFGQPAVDEVRRGNQ